MKARVNIGDSRVIESRELGDGMAIRRRREMPDGHRFTTYERVEKPNLIVIKKDGSRELYDREKLTNAIRRSVGKFFSGDADIEKIIDDVEDGLHGKNDMEIPSNIIGDFVLDELAKRNDVAYVRFASVYHEFKTLDEFESILKSRRKEKKKK